jgi:protein-disulfide isomerase
MAIGLEQDSQEVELILDAHRSFAGRMIGRARRAAAVAAACAILSSVAVAQSSGRTAANARTHASAAAGSAGSIALSKTLGNKNAPITMELFSDYQCPVCGDFFEKTLRPMINEYVAGGKVYLVHHDFPLQKHAYSGQAARWANAAAKIGKFQEVDAALYDSQAKWAIDADIEKFVAGAMSATDFKRVQAIMKTCTASAPTSMVGDAVPQVGRACLVDEYIVQDIVLGYQLPVKGTPTFVIHYKGQTYPAGTGIVTWPVLKQFFDSLLSQ